MLKQNQIKIKQIDITPDKSLMPKIGRAGYSISQAISELVDNSLDARFSDKTLHVNVILNKDFIEVIDDGRGMDENTAEKSLKLAYSEKKNQLGEFGLGLKTACQSLGKKFIVRTTQSKNKNVYFLEFDEEVWMRNGDWTRHPMGIQKTNFNKSGTSIKIEKLKIKYYPNLVTKIKEDLSLRFGPYINNGTLILKVNTTICYPKELELTEEGKTDFSFKLSNGGTIKGWVGLMKSGYSGNKGYYGFNTYRQERLITQYDKIGFTPHPEYRRIVGEIFAEGIPITHNKREWIKESSEYMEMTLKMKDVVKPFLSKARKYETISKVSPVLEEKMDAQEQIIAKAIKNLSELKQYALPNVQIEKGKKIEVEIEKRNKPEISVIQEVKEPETEKDRNPKKIHKKKKYELIINGKKFKFIHKFMDLEDEEILKQVSISEDKGIEIFTNTSFPAFSATKDSIFYATMNIAEGVAEIMVKEKNEDKIKIFVLRDLILKRTAEIMRAINEEKRLRKEMGELNKKLQEIRI